MKTNILVWALLCLNFNLNAQEAELLNVKKSNLSKTEFSLNMLEDLSEDRLIAIKNFVLNNAQNIELNVKGNELSFILNEELSYYGIAKALSILNIQTLNVSTDKGIEVMNFNEIASLYSIEKP